MKASADSKKSRRPSAGNSSSISSTRCRRFVAFKSSVRRRPIWLRIRRISGLVRLMSDGGTTRYSVAGFSPSTMSAMRQSQRRVTCATTGIAIQPQERHCGGKHAGALVVRLVHQLPRGRGDDGVRSLPAKMRRRHHRDQCSLDRAPGVRQERGDAGERLVLLGIEDMKDGADQQRMAGLLPMIPPLQ